MLFMAMTESGLFVEYPMTDEQGICDEAQTNGPIMNEFDDDLIDEYNRARPCTKEYSIYQMAKGGQGLRDSPFQWPKDDGGSYSALCLFKVH